jgi:hypothetical protein
MERIKQELDFIKSQLDVVESDWKDAFSDRVVEQLNNFDSIGKISEEDLLNLLQSDYEVAITIVRLFLEKSKDEFNILLRSDHVFGEGAKRKTLLKKDPAAFLNGLKNLNFFKITNTYFSRSFSWSDILKERLKLGRGSAIRGQARGRFLEDVVEKELVAVFGNRYEVRCNFLGLEGFVEAKADFAIPNKETPSIIIEVKAYGATGSKQTDSIGDVNKIIKSKRHDTYFLFFTDGITWLDRESDLRKIVKYQNEGYIYKIYTVAMLETFRSDLIQIKMELGL